MIAPIREGPYFPVTLSTTPTPAILGRAGKTIMDGGSQFRFGGGGDAPWNGTTSKRDRGTNPTTVTNPTPRGRIPKGDEDPPQIELYTGPIITDYAPDWYNTMVGRGRRGPITNGTDTPVTTTPDAPTTPTAPPIANLPAVPDPRVSPGDVGPDTDDNLDKLGEIFTDTFGGSGGFGAPQPGGGGTVVLPTTLAGGGDGSSSSGGPSVMTILLLVGIGAAAYFGYRWWKKRKGAGK